MAWGMTTMALSCQARGRQEIDRRIKYLRGVKIKGWSEREWRYLSWPCVLGGSSLPWCWVLLFPVSWGLYIFYIVPEVRWSLLQLWNTQGLTPWNLRVVLVIKNTWWVSSMNLTFAKDQSKTINCVNNKRLMELTRKCYFWHITFYWLCYFSCPIFSSFIPLHPALLSHSHSPTLVHVHGSYI